MTGIFSMPELWGAVAGSFATLAIVIFTKYIIRRVIYKKTAKLNF